jgi:hypothetical protein
MAASTYDCPYCCSSVSVLASVCAHCGRDLLLFRPLALRMAELADELGELRSTVSRLQATLADDSRAHVPEAEVAAPTPPGRALRAALALLVACVLATGLAHWILLFVYDAPPVALRIVTLLLPAAIALAMAPRLRTGWRIHAGLSLFTGIASVALMLGITARIDGVAWLPETARDLRESFEYAAAIALSAWTGHLLYLHGAARARGQRAAMIQGGTTSGALLERDDHGRIHLGSLAHRAQRVAEAVAPVVSGATALYSGLKAFMD